MIACFQISNGKFTGECQSNPTPGTLLANAIAAGYPPGDLEERVITQAELTALLVPPAPTPNEMEAAILAALAAPLQPLGGIDLFKLIKAKAISDEAYRLGKAPNLLTTLELQALRQRLATIYKAL